jgi:hypothetical protein
MRWRAIYEDGSFFDEVEAGVERGWSQIDHARVRSLAWVNDGQVVVAVDIPAGATPIVARRKTQIMPLDGGPQRTELKYLKMGYNQGGVATILRIHPDGTLHLTTRDD